MLGQWQAQLLPHTTKVNQLISNNVCAAEWLLLPFHLPNRPRISLWHNLKGCVLSRPRCFMKPPQVLILWFWLREANGRCEGDSSRMALDGVADQWTS